MQTRETPLIEVKGLRVHYPRASEPALNGISFEVHRGETLLLLGPSGSGKSTIGLCLAGLIPASVPALTAGLIRLDGRDAAEMTVSARTARIGIVFQDPEAQFCMLTVEDEVAFGLENMAVPRREMDGRIQEALEQVGLAGRRRERVDRLSGGQKQRLALASALARRPPILFLDEPTANLDPATRFEFFQLLKSLRQARPELTIILVEHVLDDLIDLVDRVLLLRPGGVLHIEGDPSSVFSARSDELDELGIWLPQVTALGHKLRRAGVSLDRLPLTPAEAQRQFAGLLERRRMPRPRNRNTCGGDSRQNAGPAISVRDLSHRYGQGVQSLRSVTLDVPAGAFLAIMGPNGAGKTTLASHFVDILRPPPSRVYLLGDDITTLSTAEITARAGYVFQNPEHQFVEGRVEDELAYSLRVRRRPADEIRRTVDGLLQSFGLAAYRDMNPFKLSQGQKRRLSVATMLAVGQKVLVLDEPTFGQDRNTAHALMARLCDLHRQGVTIITITHDIQLVADYAERAAVLAEGELVFGGPTPAMFGDEELMQRASLRPLPLHDLAHALDISYEDGTRPLTIREWLPFFAPGRDAVDVAGRGAE